MKLLDAKCHTTIIYNINKILGYNLTWRENDGIWQEAWPNSRETRISGIYQHTLTGLKCGTKYSIKVTATDDVGTSSPVHVDVTTLGGGMMIFS